jgi:hypothetical protein
MAVSRFVVGESHDNGSGIDDATRHANLCVQTKIECMLEGRPDPLLAIICERNHF